ncbi:MAG: hypothetical protein ACOX6T_23085 [Myxococcales bacterium]
MLDVIEQAADRRGWRPLLFGGTLRDLLIEGCPPPRDLDFVVPGVSLEELRAELGGHVERRTRFGGLRLRIRALPVDIWPLEQTWAFANGLVADPSPATLPRTTFLSAEAAAVEIWPREGRTRTIHSSGLFESFATSCLEINLEENPYPALCVARSLLTARKLGFSLGPRLAAYLDHQGTRLGMDEIEQAQVAHYGDVVLPREAMREDLQAIRRQRAEGRATVRFPRAAQGVLPCGGTVGAGVARGSKPRLEERSDA